MRSSLAVQSARLGYASRLPFTWQMPPSLSHPKVALPRVLSKSRRATRNSLGLNNSIVSLCQLWLSQTMAVS